MSVLGGVEQSFQISSTEANYNAVLIENERLLGQQQTLSRELLDMKIAFDQLRKVSNSADSSQTHNVTNKDEQDDLQYAVLREDSAINRAQAFELKSELEKSKADLAETSSQLEQAKNTIKIRELQIQEMESEYRSTRNRKEKLKNELNRSRWEADSALNNSSIEKNKLMLQISSLTFQRDTSDNKIKELSSKLASMEQNYNDSTYAQKESEADCSKYKTELMVAKRKYKELSSLYDKQNDDINSQMRHHKSEIRKLEDTIYQLSSENKRLIADQSASTNVQSEKDLDKEQLDSVEETRFKHIFHRPDRIIDHYSMLLDQSHDNSNIIQDLKATNIHLQKSLDKVQNEFTYKSTAYQNLTEAHNKLKLDYKDQSLKLNQSEKEKSALKDDLKRQKRDAAELSKNLQDRDYQLQYVLKNNQNKSLGPQSNPNFVSQLMSVYLEPASNPANVEFKEIQDLQSLNARLLAEVRELTLKVDGSSQQDTQNVLHTTDTASQGISSLSSIQGESREPHSTEAAALEDNSDVAKKNRLPDVSSQRIIEEYEIKVNKFTKEVQELQSELATSREDITTAKREGNIKENHILHLKKTCGELEQKVASLERNLNVTTTERSRLKGKLDAAEEREKDIKKRLSALESRSANQLEELHSLDQRLNEKHTSYQSVLNDLCSAQNEVSELAASISRNTVIMKQKEDDDNKTAQSLRDELERTKSELSSVKKNLHASLHKNDNLSSPSNQDGYMKHLGTVARLRVVTERLEDQEKTIKELVKEKKSLMDRLDEAQETIKTNHLSRGQSLWTSSSSTTTSVQSRLLADSEKRVVELQEKLTSYQQEIDHLKQETQNAAKLNQENLQQNRDFVTKSIHNISHQNELLISTQTKSQQSIYSFELSIKTANTEIDKLKQANDTLSSQLLSIKTENAGLASKLDASKEEVDLQISKVITLEENARIQEELLDDRQKEVQNLHTELQGLRKELANAKGYEAAAKEYVEEYKQTLNHSIERWNTTMESLNAQYTSYGTESTNWSQKLQQLIEENVVQITQEVPPVSGEEATAMIESLQRLNKALTNEKKDMEMMLESKLELLETAQKELISEKSELTTLVEKVAFLRDSNQALLTKAKPNDDLYQTELRAYGVQNEKLRREKEQLSAELVEVTHQLNTKIPEIQLLEGQVSTLTSELEAASTEVQKLIESEKQWAARSSNLLKVTGHMDPKEMEELKSEYENTKTALASSKNELEALTSEHALLKVELESSKAELETARKELESAQSNMKELETSKGDLESERRELIKKANDRARFAVEFKKRCNEAEKKLEEKEKKLAEEESKITELEKKLAEEGKVVEPKPTSHASENKETSSEDARSEAVSKLEVSEKQLARVQEELTLLKKRYQAVLARMHAFQSEKTKCEKELEELKAAKPSETKGSAEDAEKIKQLQSQVAELTKSVSDGQVENNRLKAMTSMATNRSKKLVEEISIMKGQLEKVIAEKARIAAAKVPPPSTVTPTPAASTEEAKLGDKRAREEGELEDVDIPTRNVQPHLT